MKVKDDRKRVDFLSRTTEDLGRSHVGRGLLGRAEWRCCRIAWIGVRGVGEGCSREAALRRSVCAAATALVEAGATQRRRGERSRRAAGRASGRAAKRNVLVLRSKRNRARRARKRGEASAGPVTHAPDLEQLIQERREAIHSAAAISASPLASESETEILQPPSDRPTTPD
ncbi:hypothetical protein NDU88_000838 [Pleurodeles waltl]|uniref:Uncharacterized protein n=1 Tax=Pleurodeles waltl TaxID=8319 RepID=A0AAV7SY74_PLEWA|nr:hypothetical protein NDU88_000838 [Pleurodeles waltl]